jgi:ADP-heptose:LPS heptosyltransferase
VSRRVLVARLDNDGDVLITGPAIRAVAAHADEVLMLCGPRGQNAAALLPGVDRVLTWRAPWLDPEPDPVTRVDVDAVVDRLGALGIDEAVIFTSFHQSPLPLALLLRMAGVARVSAISEDYPGSLLDVRHHVPAGVPEPLRALSLAETAGFTLPVTDDGTLAVRRPLPSVGHLTGTTPYVVLHPGASVPARSWPAANAAATVAALARAGHRVVVTGSAAETALTEAVCGGAPDDDAVIDLGGRTSLAELAAVLDDATCVVVANTGPAHLAAAVGTAVVSLFAPTVPAAAWAPYGVPVVLLGDQDAPCRGSRARVCPVPGHPCLTGVGPAEVLAAVADISDRPVASEVTV